jgi:hypothetical protein
MQYAVSGDVDGHLEHGRGPVNKAPLVAAGLAALFASWFACMALAAAFILKA